MPQTETVTNELRAITTGLGNEAEQISNRALGAGFTAIAAGMSQVRDAINEVRARLHTAADAIGNAATAARSAPNEASPQQVIAALTPAADRTDTTHREITAALGRADDIHRLVNQVLQGGNPGRMLSMLNNLKQTLAKVRQHAEQTRHHLTEAVTQARQLGESGN